MLYVIYYMYMYICIYMIISKIKAQTWHIKVTHKNDLFQGQC